MVFGLKFKKGKSSAAGELRVVVNTKGELRELEIVSPLVLEECAPALTEAFTKLNELNGNHREGRVEKVLADGRRQSGILDRLRGKAKDREEAALAEVPAELFRGTAGGVTATIDGKYNVVLVEVDDDASPASAISRTPDAIEAASKRADEGWLEAVKKAHEEAEEDSADPEEES